MKEDISTSDQFSILAPSPRRDDRTRVLKHGDTFAVFDHFGAIEHGGAGEQGIYHEGTRHLSGFHVLIEDRPPLLLSSTVRDDNCLLTVDLSNPDLMEGDEVCLCRDTIHLFLSIFLYEGRCFCRLHLRNYALEEVAISWALLFKADFADIFEVRGTPRKRRGELLKPVTENDGVRLRYGGLDGVIRETYVQFGTPPARLLPEVAKFDLKLPPKGEQTFEFTIGCSTGLVRQVPRFDGAFANATKELQSARLLDAHVETSNEQFNEWLARSVADLHMMVTHTPHGTYPYAGVPWFSTAFGRDGIVTALEYLWLGPHLARGVLQFLAATQAREVDPANDAQPGKILHEARSGEMAALGEIPFRRYYGTVDATPLFIVLAHAYYMRTSDQEFIAAIWPNIEAALRWIDEYADMDGDGFFEYARQSETGLVTQGWKDSFDSVFHADGRLAEPPIALCEVQGYVYAAWKCAAQLAEMLGQMDRAAMLKKSSTQLQQAFENAFWCEELGTYALALDRYNKPCCVSTSNPGHLLFTEIVDRQRAKRVADFLLSEQMFSGWGIRTVATREGRYNPMAYHNGSVWPHDNALIAWGLARYGFQENAVKIMSGLFDATLFMDLHRMPELFCGFPRRHGEGPTLYPVSCAPQSWAAGAVFLLLQSCIGLSVDATAGKLFFTRPVLPEYLDRVFIRNLTVKNATVDLRLDRHAGDVGINIVRRSGDLEINVIK